MRHVNVLVSYLKMVWMEWFLLRHHKCRLDRFMARGADLRIRIRIRCGGRGGCDNTTTIHNQLTQLFTQASWCRWVRIGGSSWSNGSWGGGLHGWDILRELNLTRIHGLRHLDRFGSDGDTVRASGSGWRIRIRIKLTLDLLDIISRQPTGQITVTSLEKEKGRGRGR